VVARRGGLEGVRATWFPAAATSMRMLLLPTSSILGLSALLVSTNSMALTAASGKRR
jgi:hypothetical protein